MLTGKPVENEVEWVTTSDIHSMLGSVEALPGHVRKLDFFSIACCWRLEPLLVENESRSALEALEQSSIEVEDAGDQLYEVVRDLAGSGWRACKDATTLLGRARYYAAYAISEAVRGIPGGAADSCARAVTTAKLIEHQGETGEAHLPCERDPDEMLIQRELLRCIVGNPFRPVVFADSWRSDTAVALATGIYDERAFDRLSILADALEEAGCDHADVLTHCRNPGIHARGCWVVDNVLGKRD